MNHVRTTVNTVAMAESEVQKQLQELVIRNVVHENEIGRGANGKISKGTWEGAPCAIKEIHSIFAEVASQEELSVFQSAFIEECRRSSKLRHPNIVQFLGVYFRPLEVKRLPCLVMELLHSDLTNFLTNNQRISYRMKLSILHDVALGLRFLHSSDPPIIHRDLSSNNILISRGCVAKIGDLGTARFLNPTEEKQLSRMTKLTKAPGTVDFMSPEVLFDDPKYGAPLDVFSFGCASLHTISHEWPTPSAPVYTDTKTGALQPRSEVERRSLFFSKFNKEMAPLKALVIRCLENDPKARPTMVEVCDNLLKLRSPNLQMPLFSDMSSSSDQGFSQGKVRSKIATACWDRLKKSWVKCASLPKKVQVGTTAVVDSKIYVKGNGQDFILCYCSIKDAWSKLPILPLYGYSLACASSEHLLAIGGIYYDGEISTQVRLFDPADNSWHDDRITRKMKVARFNATAVSYESCIIIIGGLTNTNMTTTQAVEVLKVVQGNLSSSHWLTVQSMPYGASIPMTSIVDSTLYVAGGYAIGASLHHITSVSISELLNSKDDGTTKIWSDISPLPCSTSSFTSYKGHLLLFGGDYIKGASNKQFTWQTVPYIYMFHSEMRQWEKVGKIPTSYYLGRCVNLTASKIFFIGGQTDVSSTSSDALLTQCMMLEVDDQSPSADVSREHHGEHNTIDVANTSKSYACLQQ